MIEVSGLVKQYGKKRAVDGIGFTINDGEVVGFLGPNGAGKTTTMSMITGYLSATEGTIRVSGMDVLDDAEAVRKKIGYLPEQPPLYLDMTVDEYLDFAYDLKKATQPRNDHLHMVCEMVGISHVRERVIKNLSKGYKQRVGLASALIGDPEVLILDEPTVGLDPIQIIEIRNVIKELGKKRTIILSSHILPEVQAVCERVLVIHNGMIVADDTPEHLSSMFAGEHKLLARIEGEKVRVLDLVGGLNGVRSVVPSETEKEAGVYEYVIESQAASDIRRQLFAMLAKENLSLLLLKPLDLTLEDIFLKLTVTEAVSNETAVPDEPVKQEEQV